MIQAFIKNNNVKYFNVQGGKVCTSLEKNGLCIINPTLEDFMSEGWELYTVPTPEPLSKEELYKDRVVELIRMNYSINEELACLRQKETKSKEYDDYFNFCESCKKQAYEEIYKEAAPKNLAPRIE